MSEDLFFALHLILGKKWDQICVKTFFFAPRLTLRARHQSSYPPEKFRSEALSVANIQYSNLRNIYIPSEALPVDEQLVGHRIIIPGRTYMLPNLRKYGVKFFWLCEATTGFALKGMIYSRMDTELGTCRNLANDIVMKS